jgi:hypothetical protein
MRLLQRSADPRTLDMVNGLSVSSFGILILILCVGIGSSAKREWILVKSRLGGEKIALG